MNLNEIQDLIKFVSKSGVTEVEIEKKDFKITIKSETNPKRRRGVNEVDSLVQQMPMAMPQMQAMAMPQMQAPAAPAPVAAPAAEAPAAEEKSSNHIEIKSPMIGTFYRKPSPDKPAFIEVGDMVQKGDVVCIIEAMKLFNEIEAEVSGKVVKVLVDENSPVEYDQALFIIDPS
ncbi:MAG: acetyl-CoA carboxylase biotin carboxyl carrier protein [Flavobacteriales bacterium]|nr:acetyl-CoA carboxylase biotin carboxyl carrier protein [Flavobacteriales bacterium]MDG1767412.1 acetyl-CoA carboxylase biotin carboxyl carrier protein [Flavobacteriales bacterium]